MALRLIDRTSGVNIGNLVSGGGLAAAFDGVTSQGSNSSAFKFGGPPGWVGKDLAAPSTFGLAVVYGSSNAGFVTGANPSTTITIYGSTGSPPSGATPWDDGTELGTITFTDTDDESAGRSIVTTDPNTKWDNIWATITHGGSENVCCSELVLYSVLADGLLTLLL